jgi:hypothetical protein
MDDKFKRELDDFIASAKQLIDDIQIRENLELVQKELKVIYDKAAVKINEVKNDEELKAKLKDAGNTVKDKTIEAAHVVKDKTLEAVENTKEYLNRPDVKEKIDNAKDKTKEAAEKSVETVKEWFKPKGDK